ITDHYDYILTRCRLTTGNVDEGNDLAQDTCEKILSMDESTLERLSQNPRGYIHTMVINRNTNNRIVKKNSLKLKAELLYVWEGVACLEDSLTDLTSSNPQILAEQIAKLKGLTEFERMIVAIAITYTTVAEFARRTGIKPDHVTKYLNQVKEKLK